MSEIVKPKKNEKVKVVVRCRPMTETEEKSNHKSVIKFHRDNEAVEICHPRCGKKGERKIFEFDAVYDENSKQEDLYGDMVRPLISNVLNGFNATIFAYGQTGTGKTYTMEGDETSENKGIIPRAFDQIFEEISRTKHAQFMLRASYMEIYQDELRDLLNKDSSPKLEIRENREGAFVDNLTTLMVETHEHIKQMFKIGKANRTTRTTDMNDRSSRSHAIFTLRVEMSGMKGSVMENTNWVGNLNLVDLAGSERQSKTNSEGTRLKEASKINLSLNALGNVISALQDTRGSFAPYRDSKLTRLLKDSLGGNSKTLMIANIGPSSYNYDESLITLRFASRAKNIKNEPRVNEDPVDTILKDYQEQILLLKAQIAQQNALRKEKPKASAKSGKGEKRARLESEFDEAFYSDGETPEKRQLDTMETESLCSNESLPETECVWNLKKEIEIMERRMLRGSTNILDHTNELQKALEAQAIEIRKRKQKEQEMELKLEIQEETAYEIKGEFSNLQQEVESKSKRLKKVYNKLQHFHNEIRDIAEEFNTDRRELEMSQNDLLRELKLALIIIDNFIPTEDKKKILSRLFFDDVLDDWKIMPESELPQDLGKPHCSGSMQTALPTASASHMEVDQLFDDNSSDSVREDRFTLFRDKNNSPSHNQAETQQEYEYTEYEEQDLDHRPYTRGGMEKQSSEDLIALDLVTPLRTTRDYESPKMSPVLKSIFDAALKGEEDIDVDAASISSRNGSTRSKSGSIPRSSHVPSCLVYKMLNSGVPPRFFPASPASSPPVLPASWAPASPASSAPVYPKARGWVPK